MKHPCVPFNQQLNIWKPGEALKPSLLLSGPMSLGPDADRCPSTISSLPSQLFEVFYSGMKHLPGSQDQAWAYKELQELEDFIVRKVEQSQHTLHPTSPLDFINSFLIHMQEVLPVVMVDSSKPGVGWDRSRGSCTLAPSVAILTLSSRLMTLTHLLSLFAE